MVQAVVQSVSAGRRATQIAHAWVIGRAVSAQDLRVNSADALRLLLALLVVFSHAYPLSGNPNEIMAVLSGWRLDLGSIAVAGFFTLSGYLITRS